MKQGETWQSKQWKGWVRREGDQNLFKSPGLIKATPRSMSSGQELLVSLILEQRLCHCHVTAVSCQKQGGAASDSLSILFFKQKPSLSYIVRPFIKLRLRAKLVPGLLVWSAKKQWQRDPCLHRTHGRQVPMVSRSSRISLMRSKRWENMQKATPHHPNGRPQQKKTRQQIQPCE